MILKDLIKILKNQNGESYSNFVLKDMDGNEIVAERLLYADYLEMKEWHVTQLIIDEHGHAEITLNSGNFKDFGFANVI